MIYCCYNKNWAGPAMMMELCGQSSRKRSGRGGGQFKHRGLWKETWGGAMGWGKGWGGRRGKEVIDGEKETEVVRSIKENCLFIGVQLLINYFTLCCSIFARLCSPVCPPQQQKTKNKSPAAPGVEKQTQATLQLFHLFSCVCCHRPPLESWWIAPTWSSCSSSIDRCSETQIPAWLPPRCDTDRGLWIFCSQSSSTTTVLDEGRGSRLVTNWTCRLHFPR